MSYAGIVRFDLLTRLVAAGVVASGLTAQAQDVGEIEAATAATEPPAAVASAGPAAAHAFEKSFRTSSTEESSRPIRLDACENITVLRPEFWSKKDVLTDFKKHRAPEQVGVIVFLKTEYCCTGSRLCAITTACLEKKSTPLVGRFRVYGGWIKNDPDHPERSAWDEEVIREYDFIQGPGARVVVMVPTWDGKMYQWHTTATKLGFDESLFDATQGETPELERFLQTAIDYAPARVPATAVSAN